MLLTYECLYSIHWSAPIKLKSADLNFFHSFQILHITQCFYSLVAVLHYWTIWCGIISIEFPQDTPSELLALKYHLMNSNVLTLCN